MTSTMPQREPRNPFYILLMLASVAFVATALAVAIVPVLEQKAREAGQNPPPSPFRDALRGDQGLTWLAVEAVAVVIFGLLSMGLDRLRSLKKARAAATIAPTDDDSSTPSGQTG
jgi:hypothetical protein